MICVKKPDASLDDFLSLLNHTRKRTLKDLLSSESSKKLSANDFEDLVFEKTTLSSKGTIFNGHVEQTGRQTFPDIVALQYYGIEVKMTMSDKWTSIGNSILESTRIESVQRIYMFFGKLGGEIDIKYRPYAECLPDVAVTHSPRYIIDMDIESDESIFSKIGVNYDKLRQNDPIGQIKRYFKSQLCEGEELWWIDPQNESPVSPIIRPFSGLSMDDRRKLCVESMILFPEIFSNDITKFERLAAYLVVNYNIVSSNLRDNFTAGGTVSMRIKDKRVTLPRVLYKLHQYASMIKIAAANIEEEKLLHYWRVDAIEEDRLKQWKSMLDSQSRWCAADLKATDIFEVGCDA